LCGLWCGWCSHDMASTSCRVADAQLAPHTDGAEEDAGVVVAVVAPAEGAPLRCQSESSTVVCGASTALSRAPKLLFLLRESPDGWTWSEWSEWSEWWPSESECPSWSSCLGWGEGEGVRV
jgi:hypothetical protein